MQKTQLCRYLSVALVVPGRMQGLTMKKGYPPFIPSDKVGRLEKPPVETCPISFGFGGKLRSTRLQ